jgi:hypothetical protein
MTKPYEQLARRIQVLWMAVTGSDHPRGAYSWFARKAGVAPHTVRKWVTGAHEPNSKTAERALRRLAELEAQYAIEVSGARKRLRRYWAHKREGERQTLFKRGR